MRLLRLTGQVDFNYELNTHKINHEYNNYEKYNQNYSNFVKNNEIDLHDNGRINYKRRMAEYVNALEPFGNYSLNPDQEARDIEANGRNVGVGLAHSALSEI
jgi:hypothetical protein